MQTFWSSVNFLKQEKLQNPLWLKSVVNMTDVGDKLPFSCLDANWLHFFQFVHISQFPELFCYEF